MRTRIRCQVFAICLFALAAAPAAGTAQGLSPAACPGVPEVCNHLDDDCDGIADKDQPSAVGSAPLPDPAQKRFGRFGSAMADVGDLNGDGTADFAVAATPSLIFSGADRSPVCFLGDPVVPLHGGPLANLGDITGDGVVDVAVGTPGYTAGGVAGGYRGAVEIYSGATCTLVRRCRDHVLVANLLFEAANGYRALGRSLGAIEDVDGDGVTDIVAGDPSGVSTNLPSRGVVTIGRVAVFSGASCAVLRRFEGSPGPTFGSNAVIGSAVADVGDENGDQVPEVAIAGSSLAGGFVSIYSGNGWALSRTLTPGTAAGNEVISSLARLPDVSGDGLPEVAAGGPNDDSAATDGGAVYLFSGSDGALIRTCRDPSAMAGDGLGRSLASVPDANDDGFGDLLAGAAGADTAAGVDAGRALLLSGADCAVLLRLEDPEGRAADEMGRSVSALGDLNDDGRDDFVLGAPFATAIAGGAEEGKARLFAFESDCDSDGVPPFGGDCDDADPRAAPGLSEVCDDADNDCDGATDEGWDGDADGVVDCHDLCPTVPDPEQADTDLDGQGDACDPCPLGGDPTIDSNGNGVADCADPAIVAVGISFDNPIGRGSGTVTWTTLSEIDQPTFNVVEVDARGTSRVLNDVPIPCEQCGLPLGQVYLFFIPRHRSGKGVFVERITASGVTRFGPAERQ
jgi:hypothetical protein